MARVLSKRPRRCLSVAVAALSLCAQARATDRFWNNRFGGSFNDNANWQGAAIPGAGDVARFGLTTPLVPANYTVTFASNVTNQAFKIEDDGVTLDLNGKTYTTTLAIGNEIGNVAGGSGRITVTDGSISVATNSQISLGAVANAAGVLTFGAGGQITGLPNYIIGAAGAGTLNIGNGAAIPATQTTLGNAAGSSGTLNITSGSFTLTGDSAATELTIGNLGTGTVNVNAGAQLNLPALNGDVSVAAGSGSNGSLIVSGAGASATMSLLNVGRSGIGTVSIINGGHVTANGNFLSDVQLGEFGGSGTITIDGAGSLLTSKTDVQVGIHHEGTLNVSNAAILSLESATLSIAAGDGSHGIVNVSGSGSLVNCSGVTMGSGTLVPNAIAELNVTAAAQLHSFAGRIGEGGASTATATIDGAGSSWNSENFILIGRQGNGSLILRNGGEAHTQEIGVAISGTGTLQLSGGGKFTSTQFLDVAENAGSTGSVIIDDAGSTLSSDSLFLGGTLFLAGGNGKLILNGGSASVNTLKLWPAGEVHLHGGSFSVAQNATTSDGSLVVIDGGTMSVAGNLTISDLTNFSLQRGTLSVPNATPFAGFGRSFEWTGGTLNLTASGLTIGNNGAFGNQLLLNSRMNLQLAGALQVDSGAQLIGGGGTISAAGGTNNGSMSIIGGILSYSQPAVNNGNLDALRATLNFPGDGIKNNIGLTNNGVMTLSDVTVNGDVHSPTGSTIKVASNVIFNGLVSGGGSFPGAGSVTFNGGYSPGDSPAMVNFAGDVSFGSRNSLNIEIGGTTAGTQHDKLVIAGQASLTGALSLSALNGFVPGRTDSFTVLSAAGRTGTFNNAASTAAMGDGAFDITYSPTAVILNNFHFIPQWNIDADGSWSTAANWNPAIVPNNPSDTANFLGKITAPRTITLDGDKTVSSINFDNANAYTIAPGSGGTLTIGNATAGSIGVVSGAHSITSPIAFAGAVTKTGPGTLTLAGAQNHPSGASLIVSDGRVNLNSNAGQNLSLQIQNTGVVVLGSDQDLHDLSMTIADAGPQQLDLNSPVAAGAFRSLRIHAADLAAAKTSLTALIANARLNPSDGIFDSGLAAHANSAVGIAQVGGSILIRPTRIGDLNLDGQVSISDFIDLASHFNGPGSWQEGDLNYDGQISISDFIDLASNFGGTYAGDASPISAVPEPAGFVSAIALGAMIGRYRRKGR